MFKTVFSSLGWRVPDFSTRLNCKLAFRSASIQTRPTFFFFNLFHLDVHDNTEEKVCCSFHHIVIFKQKNNLKNSAGRLENMSSVDGPWASTTHESILGIMKRGQRVDGLPNSSIFLPLFHALLTKNAYRSC